MTGKWILGLAALSLVCTTACSRKGTTAGPQGGDTATSVADTATSVADTATAAAPDTASGHVTELSTALFKQRVNDYESHPGKWVFKGDKPAVIDFYATWCKPCMMLAPVVESIAAEYGDKVDFYKVDIDREPELARIFKIDAIPLLLFVPKNGEPRPYTGGQDRASVVKMLKSVM